MASPLALSDAQLAIVLDAARTVPPEWRSRFLQDIADQLFGRNPSDTDVAAAVEQVVARIAPALSHSAILVQHSLLLLAHRTSPPALSALEYSFPHVKQAATRTRGV
jgi:hypothetical protein